MNKKLLSVAVAAAVAAPLSALAGSDVTLYGKAHISQDYADADRFAGQAPADTKAPYNGWNTQSRASRLGVKGSEDLGSGLKAIFKMEFQIAMADNNDRIADNDGGSIKMRNTYVGLSGDWGTGLIGRHDSPLKTSTGRLDLFSDYMADYNATVGFVDHRFDSIVMYVSPSWNGLTASASVTSPGGSTATGSGTSRGSDSIAGAYDVAVMYANGPWFASAAYEQISDDSVSNPSADDDWKFWRAGFGYNAESWGINAVYEGHKDNPTVGSNDPVMYQVQGQYKFGNNAVKAMFGRYDGDGRTNVGTSAVPVHLKNEDHDTWALGLDHNFSKRTRMYVLYTGYDSDTTDSDWDGGSLGMIHKF
jgi:predicted porin